MTNKPVYLSGLNGLRAIAALSVLIAHVFMPAIADFGLPSVLELPMAGFGVTLFFVISGFLITYLLLLETKKSGTVSIKKFYFRRILRIWPIYYLFIFMAIVLALTTGRMQDILSSRICWYLFFAANIPFILQSGIGKPKLLKHELTGYWSRRSLPLLLIGWMKKTSRD